MIAGNRKTTMICLEWRLCEDRSIIRSGRGLAHHVGLAIEYSSAKAVIGGRSIYVSVAGRRQWYWSSKLTQFELMFCEFWSKQDRYSESTLTTMRVQIVAKWDSRQWRQQAPATTGFGFW